MYVMLV